MRPAPDKGIYLAYDRVLDRPVVVDVFANNAIMPNGLTVSAWEARVLGKLDDHPNIATAQDYWEEGKRLSWSAGTSPAEPFWTVSRARGNPVRACRRGYPRIAVEIASGLEHIHGRRILYRDLQPRNVLFDEWGTVHLVDFDTAVCLDDQQMSDLSHRPVIEHMAPELQTAVAPTNALTCTLSAPRSMKCARGAAVHRDPHGDPGGGPYERAPAVGAGRPARGVEGSRVLPLAAERDQRPASAGKSLSAWRIFAWLRPRRLRGTAGRCRGLTQQSCERRRGQGR